MAKASKRSSGEAKDNYTRIKRSKSGKSNWPSAQVGDVPDSEEDLGHSTSVKFLATAKDPTKRSPAAVSNLKNIVEEGKQKLADLLREKALGVTKRDHEFKDSLIGVILDAQREQTDMEEKVVKWSSTSKPTPSAIYQSAKSSIASSRELLGHYEQASQQIDFGKDFPTIESGWEKDTQTLQRILKKQGAKVEHGVDQLLNEDPHSSKERVKGDMSDLDTDLWNRFAAREAKALDINKGGTWAVVAKNAQQGVRHAVKDLPEDGE